MALRSLVVSLEARTAAFERGLSMADRKIAGFERSVAKIQRTLAFAATAGGIAIATKKLFDLGSAVEETRNKFETVFGAATKSVTEFGQSFATMAGLSRRTFQDMAGTVGAVVQGMGFAEQASADFAQQVLRLAGDLASFNNLETADVANRITTALTGERESMKRLGIVVQETEVQKRAFANTGKTVVSTLTQEEKATATFQLITERAGRAVGDLARTQDSAANRAKQLRAEFKTIAEDFATVLLPAIERMLPLIQSLVTATSRWVTELGFASLQIAEWGKPGTIERMAERRSLSTLGGSAIGGARTRYARESVGLGLQYLNLEEQANAAALEFRSGGSTEYLTLENNLRQQMQGVADRIAFVNELIASLDARMVGLAAASAPSASTGGAARPAGVAVEDFGFGMPTVTGRRLPQSGTHNLIAPLDNLDEQATATAASVNNLSGAMAVGIQSMGAMVQAVIQGSATMEQAMVAAITQIIQTMIQMQAQQLGSAAGPLGAVVGLVGGLLGAFVRNDPAPVRLVDVTDTAADKMNRARTGPDRVQIYVVDQRGSVRDIVEQLNRQTQRDAVPRLLGAA